MSSEAPDMTALQRQLADLERPRPDALAAFKLARRHFLSCERVDINRLAHELGVNRVTIYRWVGSREQLIGEIIWALAEQTIDRERARTQAPRRRGVALTMARFVEATITNPGFRHSLATEGEMTVRLWTRSDRGFQPRLINKVEQLLDDAEDPADVPLTVSNHELAFAAIRLGESFVYRKHITGEEPDLEAVEPVLTLLLR